MTFSLHGIPVSKGIAIGKAVLISRAALEVSHYLVEPGKEEVEAQKLLDAFDQVRQELEQLRLGLPKDSPPEMAAFLDVHGMILADPALAERRRHQLNDNAARLAFRIGGEVHHQYIRRRNGNPVVRFGRRHNLRRRGIGFGVLCRDGKSGADRGAGEQGQISFHQ